MVREADLIDISHNHPDHMHAETLSHLRRNVPIIVPDFPTNSTVRPLRRMGFTHHASGVYRIYAVHNTPIYSSILQAVTSATKAALTLAQGVSPCSRRSTPIASTTSSCRTRWTCLPLHFKRRIRIPPLLRDVHGRRALPDREAESSRICAPCGPVRRNGGSQGQHAVRRYFTEAAPRDYSSGIITSRIPARVSSRRCGWLRRM